MSAHREMIERALTSYGWHDVTWEQDTDYKEPREQAVIGRFRVVEDDENVGLYAGDEGVLRASVVGAAEYRNERVYFSFTADGYDEGSEVTDLDLLEAA